MGITASDLPFGPPPRILGIPEVDKNGPTTWSLLGPGYLLSMLDAVEQSRIYIILEHSWATRCAIHPPDDSAIMTMCMMYSAPLVLLSSPAEHAEKEERTGSELTLGPSIWGHPFGSHFRPPFGTPKMGLRKDPTSWTKMWSIK